jgi:hypothetical protein
MALMVVSAALTVGESSLTMMDASLTVVRATPTMVFIVLIIILAFSNLGPGADTMFLISRH